MLASRLLKANAQAAPLLRCLVCRAPLASASANQRPAPEAQRRVLTVPNAICLLRAAAAPCIVGCLLTQNYLPAVALTAAAGASDGLDGWIARRWPSQQSALGSLIDPLADKLLVASLSLALCHVSLLPAPLAALYVSRDLLLIGGTAAGQWRRRRADPGADWLSALQQVRPLAVSKCNTALQVATLSACLCAPLLGLSAAEVPYQLLWWMSAFTTVLSGVGYALHPQLLQHQRLAAEKANEQQQPPSSAADAKPL